MITASMTSGEIRRVRNLDEARIYEFQMRKANELKREMRKQNVRQITKTFEFATPNADYVIVVGVKHGDVFASGVFIYLKETNEYIPMSRNEGYSEDCFAMSVHFLKRFAERFLKKDLPIAKILQKIYTSFTGAVQLYSDGKTRRVVFAIPEGLILTEYEQEKHIIHYKTFVSMDMLKKTQKRSYEKISAFLMESCQQIAKARETGNDERLCVVYRRFYNDIDLLDTKEAQADSIIVPHHFSHKVTKNSCLNILVLYKDKIRGAMQIGYGIRPHIKTEKGEVLDYHQVREFDRMWLSDDMPKFSETICLSLLHKYIRATHKEIKYLISYADTSIGNKGTIYKAANYEHIDTIKADFYVLPSGERVHPVTMWHRHKTRAWEVLTKLYPGIKKAEGFQLKFLKKL